MTLTVGMAFFRFQYTNDLSAILVGLVTLLAASTARLKVQQAFRFYWSWGAVAAALAVGVAYVF